MGVKRVVQEKLPEGVNSHGLTLTGFLFLHTLFIEKGRLETTWTVLRKFGYDNDIKLRDDLLPVPHKRAPDQSVELTNEAVDFLKGIFTLFDIDGDGALQPVELDDLFSTAPESPWNEAPYKDAAGKTALDGLSFDGFLSQPLKGVKKTLVLREIPEDEVKGLLSKKESLAACDIALFVHDSSDEASWRRAKELLVDVASHGEDSGFEVPCLSVVAKDDLDPYPTAIEDIIRVSQDLGIETPIPVSMKLLDFNSIFHDIISVAEHPHLSIPETEAGRNRKHYHQLVNRSLMFVSVGAAVAIVGLAAYRVYAARRNASN
ncbi:PREDICTED: mitochondrial Rho GTPase 1-like [Nelumbo nucifera]|uniref:Mitochondrial Rho GTPase 1-like n=1 Tax=Nelumbo nucifera TaxID=4432 RepID=A0A1U8QC75_NELNU|nr:PREDICTED: mitochondrial Rho GTPase 1-like [Nelumbo nucifera]